MKLSQASALVLAAILAACGGGGKGFDNSGNVKDATAMIRNSFESQGFKVLDMQLAKESQTKLAGKIIVEMFGAKAEVPCEATINEANRGIAFNCGKKG